MILKQIWCGCVKRLETNDYNYESYDKPTKESYNFFSALHFVIYYKPLSQKDKDQISTAEAHLATAYENKKTEREGFLQVFEK